MKAPLGKLAIFAGSALTIAAALVARTPAPAEPVVTEAKKTTRNVSAEERSEMLARAQVWRAPAVPVGKADLTASQQPPVSCRFKITDLGGTAQKFDCVLDSGEMIRVKYGQTPEIPSEVAASRLLQVLGFGADDVTMAERVRCFGCPLEPFVTMKAVDLTDTDGLYKKFVDYDTHKDFEWAAVERRHGGRAIATDDVKGWAFFELDQIDAAKGGAPRAHVDALRLLAVFLAHWDNKSDNQRLLCESDADWPEDGTCRKPFAILQDVGGAFGPRKVDLAGWTGAPIWADRAQCLASMATLPYEGATFTPVRISDAGRRHLASLLGQLRDEQIDALFRAARFDHSMGLLNTGTPAAIAEWVAAFKHKVREISDGPSCPS